jgi:hypothetical protein
MLAGAPTHIFVLSQLGNCICIPNMLQTCNTENVEQYISHIAVARFTLRRLSKTLHIIPTTEFISLIKICMASKTNSNLCDGIFFEEFM